MKIRIVYHCPRCRSISFRPSISRQFRDAFLERLGVHPHRCYMCRRRFYLFKPFRIREFVEALDRPLVGQRVAEEGPASSTVAVSQRASAMVAGTRDLFRR